MAIEINHTGKASLITGAGAGIGREIALWMARAGSDVALLDKRKDFLEETVRLIKEQAKAQTKGQGARVFAIEGDARDDTRLTEMIEEATELMGGLDFAINNIGMLGGEGSSSWLEMTPARFRDAVEQNLILTAVSCQVEARLMTGENKVILNVSSGETTRPAPGLAAYGAAKAGINHLTQTLAVELGPLGIRVNAMAPGTTRTEQVDAAFSDEQYRAFVSSTPLGRETLADELGRLAVFLTSDLARCITGQVILADAGAHLSRSRPPLSH